MIFWLGIMPLLGVESFNELRLLVQLVDHMEGSHTTIRQRCLYPHTAHIWDRSLHHDGVAKLDTVHSGGRIEASKIISVVSEDALELLHKPRVTTENLRVRICPRLEAPVLSQLLHYRDHPMASTYGQLL